MFSGGSKRNFLKKTVKSTSSVVFKNLRIQDDVNLFYECDIQVAKHDFTLVISCGFLIA